MSDITEKTKRQEQIEILADAIVFGSLSETKKQMYKAQLSSLVLAEVNYAMTQEMAHPGGKTLPDFKKTKYDSIAFAKALRETLQYGYGKCDTKTGKRISFLRLFRHRYTLKLKTAEKEFLEEQNPDQARMREIYVEDFLNQLADEHRLTSKEKETKLNFNFLNGAKCLDFLRHIGASAEEIRRYEDIAYTSYREGLEATSCDDQTQSAASVRVSQQSMTAFEQTERQVTALLDMLERAKAMIAAEKQKKTLAAFFPYYVTLRVIKEGDYEQYPCQPLADYMDMELWRYCKASWDMGKQKANEVLGQYLSLQTDTVRKKMKIVQKFLLKVGRMKYEGK